MNDKIKIKVYTNDNNFTYFLIRKNIYYESLNKNNNDYTLICNKIDYNKIKIFYKTKIIKYYGIEKIINFFKREKYILISLLISFCVLDILTNTIFNITINTNNNELKNKIIKSLEKNEIKKYKRKKTYKEIKDIKKAILNENKNDIEWIEIIENGCNYIVNLTQRIKSNNIEETDNKTDIIANKDGLILHINSIKGTKIKEIGDYVKKGDVLISGTISKDDKIIEYIESKGKVYAETWYTVSVSVPYKYKEYEKTGKIINHYFLDIFGYEFTLIGKYNSNNTKNKKMKILDKPYLPFKVYKEIKEEYKYVEYSLTKEESYNVAIQKAEEKIVNTLESDEYIISKKVLKKEEFSSKIMVEVFFKVYENIASTSRIKDMGEIDETSN